MLQEVRGHSHNGMQAACHRHQGLALVRQTARAESDTRFDQLIFLDASSTDQPKSRETVDFASKNAEYRAHHAPSPSENTPPFGPLPPAKERTLQACRAADRGNGPIIAEKGTKATRTLDAANGSSSCWAPANAQPSRKRRSMRANCVAPVAAGFDAASSNQW